MKVAQGQRWWGRALAWGEVRPEQCPQLVLIRCDLRVHPGPEKQWRYMWEELLALLFFGISRKGWRSDLKV